MSINDINNIGMKILDEYLDETEFNDFLYMNFSHFNTIYSMFNKIIGCENDKLKEIYDQLKIILNIHEQITSYNQKNKNNELNLNSLIMKIDNETEEFFKLSDEKLKSKINSIREAFSKDLQDYEFNYNDTCEKNKLSNDILIELKESITDEEIRKIREDELNDIKSSMSEYTQRCLSIRIQKNELFEEVKKLSEYEKRRYRTRNEIAKQRLIQKYDIEIKKVNDLIENCKTDLNENYKILSTLLSDDIETQN